MNNIKERYCELCNQEQPFIYEKVNRDYNVKGEIINVDIEVCKCSVCGEEIWDDETLKQNEEIIFSKYRKIKGLLFPEEIREIRNKYGLSQKDFSLLLGFGEKTITRYENGALQDEAYNLLLNIVKNPYIFSYIYRKNKNRLSDQVKKDLEKRLIKLCTDKASYIRLKSSDNLFINNGIYDYKNESSYDNYNIKKDDLDTRSISYAI